MKSNKDYTDGLPGRIKKVLGTIFNRVSSKELPILRLSDSLFGKSVSKKKLLKEKYRCLRRTDGDQIKQDSSIPSLSQSSNSEGSVTTSRFPKYINKKTVFITALALLAGSFAFRLNTGVKAYAVEVNGSRIATVTQRADAEKLVEQLKTEKVRLWNRKVDVEQRLAFKEVNAKRYQLDNLVTVKNRLNKSLTFVAVATGIKVDGNIAVVVKDNKTAEAVLQQVKNSTKTDNLKVDSVSFQEKVELMDVPSSLRNVLPVDKAVEHLQGGKEEKSVHVVKEGDSLWTIARANDMRVKDLIEMNPSLSEHLDLGQEIKLVAVKPLLNVLVTGEQSVEQVVPYKVVVQTDKNMARGKEEVKTPGEKGLKKETYKVVLKNGDTVNRTLIDQKVIKEPKDRVVVQGKKVMVASRSGGGKLGWPIRGRITSPYGSRWGGTHTGLDIDGVTGQPVGAAADGVVISAGRDGGYGKNVLVRHSNGLVTRYAHLSKIEVSVGQKLSRGELLGRVGSTGHSTGSHLHFEVITGGRTVNPTKYLR